MKQITILFVLAVCLLPLMAQNSVVGTWYDAEKQIILVLYPNGTYTTQGPLGQGAGKYGITAPNYLILQDTLGRIYYYQITGFQNQTMQLMDTTGQTFSFVQQTSQQNNTTSSSLAQQNGQTFTQRHGEVVVALTQFLACQQIKPDEQQAVINAAIADFRQNPAATVQLLGEVEKCLTLLNASSNNLMLMAQVRQQLLLSIYNSAHTLKDPNQHVLYRVVNNYNQILAQDKQNNLILTSRDLQAFLCLIVVLSTAQGQNINITPEIAQALQSHIATNFTALPLETKQMMCYAEIYWTYLQYSLQQMNEQQRVAMQQQMAQARNTTPVESTPMPSNYSSSPRSAASRAADRECMRIMREVQMQRHATNMNIIENIGGGRNYWEVKNRDW